MDQAEAAEIVEEHLKTHPQEQLFDEVLIPALGHARRDRELGRLTEDGEQFVFRVTRDIFDNLDSFEPQTSVEVATSSQPASIDENSPVILPKIRHSGMSCRR